MKITNEYIENSMRKIFIALAVVTGIIAFEAEIPELLKGSVIFLLLTLIVFEIWVLYIHRGAVKNV